ncbi:hypothetical protein K469DRAFT_685100 [Zopfia rhizophila CBS 207.26]|uniref:Myb-like domain-containing protein n=1 Tax=Zopfia rhizophila CBS 207.26 TaxID=1314779 RepID=A0A6A6EB40_9PEZI|nr:hypothetical protein K469DRAFT_685100 [Zopfia rhizophila CBS 207.26]
MAKAPAMVPLTQTTRVIETTILRIVAKIQAVNVQTTAILMSGSTMVIMMGSSTEHRRVHVRTREPWSKSDEQRLLAYKSKMDMKWDDIFCRFPDRTPGAVRARWHILQGKYRDEMGSRDDRKSSEGSGRDGPYRMPVRNK